MEKDKLSQSALSASMKYDPDNEFYNQDFYQGFMSGAEWLQSQRLKDKLSEEESKEIRCMYVATKICIEDAKLGSSPLQAEIFQAQKQTLESIFGKEMFVTKE